MQRRVGVAVTGTALVLGLGLMGCAPSNTPTAYTEPVVEQNFLEGCMNRYINLTNDTLAITNDTISTMVTGGTEDQCRCQFQVFVEQVPFNSSDTTVAGYLGPNFTDLNNDLRGDNGGEAFNALPSGVQDDLKACALPAQAGPTTTLPPDAPAATNTTLPTGPDVTRSGN